MTDISFGQSCGANIVLTPIEDEPSLEELLAGSPEKCFAVTNEHRSWIDAVPVGKED